MSTSVCVCLSIRDDISGTTRAIFTNFLFMLPMSVAQSSCSVVAMLCISSFVDDLVLFSIIGRIAV